MLRQILRQILRQEDWITEGVCYAWCGRRFAEADRIYLLSVPRRKCRCCIFRRFVRKKLGLEQGKRESLSSLRALLCWTDKYRQVDMPEIRKRLAPYWDKVVEQ